MKQENILNKTILHFTPLMQSLNNIIHLNTFIVIEPTHCFVSPQRDDNGCCPIDRGRAQRRFESVGNESKEYTNFALVAFLVLGLIAMPLLTAYSTCSEDALGTFAQQSLPAARNCEKQRWGFAPWIYAISRNSTLLAYGVGTIHVVPDIVGIPYVQTDGVPEYKITGPIGEVVNAATTLYGENDLVDPKVQAAITECSLRVREDVDGNLSSAFDYPQWKLKKLFEATMDKFDAPCSQLPSRHTLMR